VAPPPEVAALRPSEVDILLDDLLPSGDDRPSAVDLDGSLARSLRHLRGRFVLVRPDRFIAATWRPGDEDRVRRGLSAYLPPAIPTRLVPSRAVPPGTAHLQEIR
jgi:hypothetical protein